MLKHKVHSKKAIFSFRSRSIRPISLRINFKSPPADSVSNLSAIILTPGLQLRNSRLKRTCFRRQPVSSQVIKATCSHTLVPCDAYYFIIAKLFHCPNRMKSCIHRSIFHTSSREELQCEIQYIRANPPHLSGHSFNIRHRHHNCLTPLLPLHPKTSQ